MEVGQGGALQQGDGVGAAAYFHAVTLSHGLADLPVQGQMGVLRITNDDGHPHGGIHYEGPERQAVGADG